MPLVDSLITFAFDYLHKPYRGGSMGPNSFDCSGFTSFVYNQFGFKLERSSGDQTRNGLEIFEDELQPGDLVFFKGRNAKASRIGHVGMVVSVNDDGTFTFIHAAVSTGVTHDRSNAPYYSRRYVTARRIIDGSTTSQSHQPIVRDTEKAPVDLKDTPITIELTPKTIHIEKGQTLYSISKKYSCTVNQLKKWNDLDGNQLQIGQTLMVRVFDADSAQVVIIEEKRNKDNAPVYHKVKAGDTLYSLSKKYGCTVHQLKQKNGLNSSRLSIGQRLRIH